MKLKYVGAKPSVSQHGVSFDQTKPDKYTFLNAAVELLEALSFENKGDRQIYLYDVEGKTYSSSELVEMLKKHCKNLEEVFSSREEKTNELIKKYTTRVEENQNLAEDDKRAWLGNIKIMRDYYLQYITNESAYDCALEALADKIDKLHIEDVTFPVGRNYGLVLSHLISVLSDHKPPYDATLTFEDRDGEAFGKLDMNRH
jgi:transposase-like protein